MHDAAVVAGVHGGHLSTWLVTKQLKARHTKNRGTFDVQQPADVYGGHLSNWLDVQQPADVCGGHLSNRFVTKQLESGRHTEQRNVGVQQPDIFHSLQHHLLAHSKK